MKTYSAIIVSMDTEKTPVRVRVLTDSETEARRILEQQYGETAVNAVLEVEDRPPRPRRRGP